MYKLDYKNYAQLARKAASEGIVLLRNRNKVLPIKKGKKIALYGRGQEDTIYSGTGSGGQVNIPYLVNIREGLEQYFELDAYLLKTYEKWLQENPFNPGVGWANTPWSQEEMLLDEDILSKVDTEIDTAIFVISRVAGEDKDNVAEKGSYYLRDDEVHNLKLLRTKYEKLVVLLNTGNIIDMSWQETIDPEAILYVWQGGCETGNAVADVISGVVNPSGHLTDTIAYALEDYPSTKNFGNPDENYYQEDIYLGYRYFSTFEPKKILYPFGYGLSYTDFKIEDIKARAKQNTISVNAQVKNIGKLKGKAVLQAYLSKAQGKLGQAKLELVDFQKTKALDAGESTEINFTINLEDFASFDDSGITAHKNTWLLEAGNYDLFIGFNSLDLEKVYTKNIAELTVIKEVAEALAPYKEFNRIRPVKEGNEYKVEYEKVNTREVDYVDRIGAEKAKLDSIDYNSQANIKFSDYKENEDLLDEFISTLSNEDLICLSRGNGMQPSGVTAGIAAAMGAVSTSLREKGLPLLAVADGPSGIRMDNGSMAFSLPIGTALASSFNEKLNEELFFYYGLELRKNDIEVVLGPGMNIHRNPLNGRNFEYFSEDPVLSGRIAIAQAKGLNRIGATACIKHFALNNQERNRNYNDSIASARAIREIYLKGFEIALKSGEVKSIMTSYNLINGIWAASNYELNTTILRDEWQYEGIVMTDWWANMHWLPYSEGDKKQIGSMIQAQNDIYMVTSNSEENSNNDYAAEEFKQGKFTRAELVRNAKNLLKFIKEEYYGYKSIDLEVINEPELDKNIQAEYDLDLVEKHKNIKADDFVSQARSILRLSFAIPNPGVYKLSLEGELKGLEVAQMNISVYVNNTLNKSISLKGDSQDKLELDLGYLPNENNYIEIVFSEGGYRVDNIDLYRIN